MRHLNDIPRSTPVGVRDFPPEAAERFYALEQTLVRTFQGAGYQRVVTPAFELAQVLEQGLGPDAAPVMRFVDPQNGELLALRSDMTPQIARLACGPMRDVPLPLRLSYFGRVFRLRTHSEFQRRELAQAGVELIGVEGPDADIELLSLCDQALRAAGSTDHVLSVGHAGFARAALLACGVREAHPSELVSLLRKKNGVGVEQAAHERGASAENAAVLASLTTLFGEPEAVLPRAMAIARALPETEEALDWTRTVLAGLNESLKTRVLLDLGEMLGFGYYTGLIYHAYLPGSGQAVASGGRYDKLLSAYGRDLPAAGFAIDEEGLTEAASREEE